MSTWITDLGHYHFEEVITVLAAAIGSGMLVGIERERHNALKQLPSFAGFRTFVLVSLLGAICFLFGFAVGIAGFLIVGGVVLVSQLKNPPETPGITSEVAFLLSYLIGALCVWQPLIATSGAVIVTGILLAKGQLNHFARRWLTEAEMRDGTLLLALALVALPMMPNKPYWGTVLNPYVTVRLLTLILLVQAVAHLTKRLLSLKNAMILSSLASGFVSSTATVASLGMQVRAGKASAKTNAGGALISCVATLIEFIVIAMGSNIAWLKVLLIPIIAGSLVGFGIGLWLIKTDKNTNIAAASVGAPPINSDDSRMFSLKEAGILAVALTLIQVVIYGFGCLLGDAGILVGALLASIFEIHGAMAAVFVQGAPVMSFYNSLLMSLLLGMVVHSLSKSINAFATGGSQYAHYFMLGLWLQTLVFIGSIIVMIYLPSF